ncbi:MAG: tol-pal system protein YbgF [Thermodesulfobacteriota bacterium]
MNIVMGFIFKSTFTLFLLPIIIVLMGCGIVTTQSDMTGVYARQTRLEAKVDRLSKQLNSVKSTESKNIGLTEKVFQLEEKINSLNNKVSSLVSRYTELNTEVSIGGTGALGSNSEAIIYNEGYKQLSEGNYEKSRRQFNIFMDKYPNSSQASDALFWISESYYREGKYEESILEYQRFIDAYPKDKRVPLSYLKQGIALVKIGRNEEAKLFFQTVIDKYPKSEEAKAAREKIRELAVNG